MILPPLVFPGATHKIKTLGIKVFDTQGFYAECNIFIVMLSVIKLEIVLLNVVMLAVVMVSDVVLGIVMQCHGDSYE